MANALENTPASHFALSRKQTVSAENAIEVVNACVNYRSYQKRPTTLKESLIRLAKEHKIQHYSTFAALTDLNFSIPKGSVVGFIGSNGAGKSTLLKVLSGVLPPSKGEVRVTGEIDSLIQLGAGFDPELNAMENIYLSGSLRGYSRSYIKERVPHILEFAELEEFSTTPIKYFSSGMFARLGFSVAIDHNPDILIVDEVLAVGDERFQNKCDAFFKDFIKQGKTIIIVSHSLDLLEELADQIGLLSKGRLIYMGDPKVAIEMYRSDSYETRL